MKFATRMHFHFSNFVWLHIDLRLQKSATILMGAILSHPWSRHMIPMFMKRYHVQNLSEYIPASRNQTYQSFQDFFTRRLKEPLKVHAPTVWPCQGIVCQSGLSREQDPVLVKNQLINILDIFNLRERNRFSQFSFVNIFLHNHHYHRIHAPVSGEIVSMKRIPGRLDLLRPWLYARSQVSRPSLRNERVVLELRDLRGREWWMSLVGGMGVGTIVLAEGTQVGARVSVGQELGLFMLGSTVCLLAPEPLVEMRYLQSVFPGHEMPRQIEQLPIPIAESSVGL